MKRSFGTRIGAVAAAVLAAMAVLSAAGPASAQIPTNLRFQSSCEIIANGTPVTAGLVDVPVGTSINGGAPVLVNTTVTTLNTPVVYPNGSVATLNVVTGGGVGSTSVTRQAIVITGGPGAGTVVGAVTCTQANSSASALSGSTLVRNCPPTIAPASGQATVNNVTVGFPAGAECDFLAGAFSRANTAGEYAIAGFPYPLAVNVAAPAAATPDLASQPASSGGRSGPSPALLIGGGVGIVLLAQIALGQRARRRKAEAPTG